MIIIVSCLLIHEPLSFFISTHLILIIFQGVWSFKFSIFKEENQNQVLFDLDGHSVGVSEYGHYTAQAKESVLNSGARNNTFLILGR